jgi:thiamine-phosphate pyrophosphorylase
MKTSPDHLSAAHAIVTAHAALALAPGPFFTKAPDSGTAVYKASYQAAQQLGFIEADAQCIARAWECQFERTGRFDPLEWPNDPVDFGMATGPRSHSFPPCPQELGLYAVLPSAQWVTRMAQAGVGTLQLRFKSDSQTDIAQEIAAAVQGVQGTQALLFINDHWQAAIHASAYGVHLGQEDLDAADLNAIRAAGLRLGISTHGYSEMLRADQCNPSYVAIGAVFPTTLKKMRTAPQGTGRLRQYAKLLRNYPLVAIGGIDHSNLADVLDCHVGSIGAVRALITADQPEAAAAEFMTALKLGHPPRN